MLAEELINQMIPPLKPGDDGQLALHWMSEFRVTQLPVIDGQQYKGIITEETILDSENSDKKIEEYRLDFSNVFTAPQTHYYELIPLASKNNLQILPVIDAEGNYMGVISINETSAALAQMITSQGPGGIIILSMKENDYSLAQISRLVESNDVKIMNCFVSSDSKDPGFIKLTMKLNRTDLTRLIATLERYDYKIIAQFQETESVNEDKERLDLLFKYLNI